MSKVYVTTYEVIGDGHALAAKHYDEIEAATEAHWAFVEDIGGVGFRPEHSGGVSSVLFTETPKGWRKLGQQGDKIEATPNRGTKAGKEMADRIASLPRTPRPDALAAAFGYSPSQLAMDSERGTIYFPTTLRVAHPQPRTFLRIPRFDGDGFTPNDTMLRAIPESELMKAVEDHNAEARRLREKDAA